MMNDDPLYIELHEIAFDAARAVRDLVPEEPPTYDEYAEAVLDALWVEIVDLQAEILEHRHALAEVVDCGKCDECQRMAQSSLDGVNRDMCVEMINDTDA